MFKEVRYMCWGYGWDPDIPEYNRVVYVIVGDCCYFSGIEREFRTSTINAAESIVKAIADQEEVPITSLRFFDLQTHYGYRKKPGEYEFDELLIEPRSHSPRKGAIQKIEVEGEEGWLFTQGVEGFAVVCWQPTPCPPEILEIFRDYIG